MYKLSRDEYRAIRTMSKEKMEQWLSNRDNIMYNSIRKEFEKNYHEEIDNSVENFLIAIAYTLHFSENTRFGPKKLPDFMEDLFVTVDMFRTGEYKPEEYAEELKKCGIKFDNYDYTKIYRKKVEELEAMYKNGNREEPKDE